MFDLKQIFNSRQCENIKLHHNINPQFAKVLSTIGFDKCYVRAQGVSLFDEKGTEYYDFLAGYGVYAFGRNHPKIKQTIRDYLDLDSANLVQMEAPLLSGLLAEKLIEIFGHGVRDNVYFTNSGTESIESAIKFVRAATGREKILHLTHAFHGLTTGALSLNGSAEFRNGFGTLLPDDMVEINDIESLHAKLKTKEFAAFVFEPIQGKGVYLPNNTFFKEALELCKKYGTISVADEIQSGIGRTGTWLASEHFGIEPDVVCLSKALSGGYVPVGAVVYKKDIYYKVFSSMDRCVVHSSTFGQNELAMACGLASLDIIKEENLLENSTKMGDLLLKRMAPLKDKYEWVKDVRGKGLMIGIEFGKPSGFKNKMAWSMAHKVDKGLFGELIVMPLLAKHHIITQVAGHNQDIVKIIPPLMINETHVNHFVESLDDVVANCGNVAGSIFKMGANLAKHVMSS